MKVYPYGDGGLYVDLEAEATHEGQRQTRALAATLRRRFPLADIVVGAGSLAVVGGGSCEELEQAVATAKGDPAQREDSARAHTFEVIYDGPDLDEVARLASLSRDEVIALHSGTEYDVALIGFLPGFAYLGSVDPRLAVPRRSVPRPRVPAGSLGLAGAYTGVYPLPSPGGWQLIGRLLDVTLFDPQREPPALLQPGDRVRFVARHGR